VVLDTGSTTLKLTMGTFFDVRLRYFGYTNHALYHITGKSGGSKGSNSGSSSRHVFGILFFSGSYQFFYIPAHIYPESLLIKLKNDLII
jgi:hypothetical protein